MVLSAADPTGRRKKLTTYGKTARKILSDSAKDRKLGRTPNDVPQTRAPQDRYSIFDVPTSDEESNGRAGNLEKRRFAASGDPASLAPSAKAGNAVVAAGAGPHQTARKRKRTGSSSTTGHKPSDGKTAPAQREPSPSSSSVLQPSVSPPVATTEGSVANRESIQSVGHGTAGSYPPQLPAHFSKMPAKPRRTQTRTLQAPFNLNKGWSAPEPLQQMLEDGNVKPTEIERSTPEPTFKRASTPLSTPTQTLSSTPKQTQLWDELLETTPRATSPSRLEIKHLEIRSRTSTLQLKKSWSHHDSSSSKRRPRLIDRLTGSRSSLHGDGDVEEDNNLSSAPLESISDQGNLLDSSLSESYNMDGSTSSKVTPAGSQTLLNTGAAPRVTYARQRSFLDEDTLDSTVVSEFPLRVEQNLARGFRPEQLGVTEEEFENANNGIRSIHELRAAGSSTRLQNEMESLLEDVEDQGQQSVSRRRSAMIELCTKLADSEFASRFIDNGFEQRLFRQCGSISDAVLGFAHTVAVGLIVKGGAPLLALQRICRSGACQLLTSQLIIEQDIARIGRERRTNMSKSAQSSLSDLREFVRNGSLFPDWKPSLINPQIVALRSFELLVRKLRECGFMEELLDEQAATNLTRVAKKLSDSGQIDTPGSDVLRRVELALSLIESASLTPMSGQSESTWSAETLRDLSGLLPLYLNLPGQEATQMEVLALRVCLNLTNNNPRICNIFASSRLVQALLLSIESRFGALNDVLDDGTRVQTIDRLILSLGALINLAEVSDSTRLLAVGQTDDSLRVLVSTFLDGHGKASKAGSEAESQSNVAHGYLAVLIANLCQNTYIRDKVRPLMPQKRPDVLFNAIDEFISYHRRVDREIFGGDEGEQVSQHFTQKLQGVVDRLRQAG